MGPAVITPREPDTRAREIRAELQVLAHDLAATRGQLKPQRQRLDETAEEIGFLNQQIEAADADITAAAERLGGLERDLATVAKEEELLTERAGAVRDAEAVARARLAQLGPVAAEEIPELPPLPQPPIQARVAVETLRRDRASLDARRAAPCRARRGVGPGSPTAPDGAGRGGRGAGGGRGGRRPSRERATEAADERDAAAAAERAAAAREAEINKAWRDASTELDRLREAYEEDDRLRGDIERRVRDAERLLREGHGLEPEAALASLEGTTRSSPSRRRASSSSAASACSGV